MSSLEELGMIIHSITMLRDISQLSCVEYNNLMLIAGRLTGLLRVTYYNDVHDVVSFTKKADVALFESSREDTGKIFYIIAVSIEMLQKKFEIRKKHKRVRNRKRNSESVEDSGAEEMGEKRDEIAGIIPSVEPSHSPEVPRGERTFTILPKEKITVI